MKSNERNKFIKEELEAIYEEIDKSINQLIILRKFLKNLVNISKGAEPNYEKLIHNLNNIK